MRVGWISLAALLAAASFGAEARTVTPLNTDWRFVRQDVPSAKEGEGDAQWQSISLPHTFNAHDVRSLNDPQAAPSPNGYYRGPAWYRHGLELRPEAGQHYYLQFDGAALTTDVYVNGQPAGHHEGGYAGFRYDVTSLLKAGSNAIAVRVDNTKVPQIAPLNGDFNVYGGLYRGVSLITVADVHIDLKDHGGPGVYITAKSLSDVRADLTARVLVANDGKAASATVRVKVMDADGKVIATAQRRQTLSGNAAVELPLTIRAPHRWQGRADPYLYHAEVTVGDDTVTVPLGLRTIGIDPDQGLILNGKPYAVHGVNMQQPGRPGKGTAVSADDIDADMKTISDLGATGIRLAHMQHPQRVYDDADAMGFVVTTEVPFVDEASPGDAFRDNIVEQMRELIAQNYNHPSIVMWGLGNEVRKDTPEGNAALAALQTTVKGLDTTRPTVYSHCCQPDDSATAMHADVTSYNRYYGWYSSNTKEFGGWADGIHARFPKRAIGVSEYGAGGSIHAQEDPAAQPPTTSFWHPEQYQAQFHEQTWNQMKARPFLWSDFVWVAFDFPSYGRNEGDRPSVNDKGLVTEDRLVRKDAWYWYQANWSDRLMVHIASPRYTARRVREVTVRVYANVDEVRLQLNGESLPAQPVKDHVATWKVSLKDGDNRIEAFAGKDLHDAVHWQYSDSVTQ